MSTIKIACFVFFIHLAMVSYIIFVVSASPEGCMGWLVFLFVDFPLAWLYVPVAPIVDMISDSFFWRFYFAPAVFFQVIGCMNWLMICLAIRFIYRIGIRHYRSDNAIRKIT